MLIKPCSLHNHNVSLSSELSYSRPFPCQLPPPRRTLNHPKVSVSCSISQVHSYGTVDYERRPMIKWNAIYKKISLIRNPELGSASVLNQWEKDGRKLTKWELCRVVKELRKYKRYKQSLEVLKSFSLPFVFVSFELGFPYSHFLPQLFDIVCCSANIVQNRRNRARNIVVCLLYLAAQRAALIKLQVSSEIVLVFSGIA